MNVHRTRKSVVAIAVALCICVALIVVYSTSNNHNVVSAADEVKMHLENINEMLEGGSDSTLPLQSSNPYDYIADNEDFQRIIELGDSALPELERTLSDSPDNGLNEYIIAIAIQEISGTDVDSFNNRTDIKWENAKQFLEEWTSAKDDAKTVRRSDEPLDIQRDIVIEYALTPEDEEWANKTPEELRAIINIPQSEIEKLSDKELLDEVLEYPYIGDIVAFDDVATGLEVVGERFTGLSEVFKRNSMGDDVKKEWMKLSALVSSSDSKRPVSEDLIMDKFILDALLSHDSIRDSLSSEDCAEILEASQAIEATGVMSGLAVSKDAITFSAEAKAGGSPILRLD